MNSFFKKNQFQKVLFFSLALIVFCVIFFNKGNIYDLEVFTLYFIISLISLYKIFISNVNEQISLDKTFHLFYFFFFGISPALQFKHQVVFFEAEQLTRDIYKNVGIIILISQLLYNLFYNIFKFYLSENFVFLKKKIHKVDFSFNSYFILSLSSFFAFLFLIDFNWDVIVKLPNSRWHKENTKMGLIGYSLLLIVRTIPMISMLHYLLNKLRKKKNKEIYVLFSLLLITVFPLSVPRATAIIFYLPILIILVPFLREKNIYLLSYFFGFLVLFPILDYFRNKVKLGLSLFLSPHLDAFHNFAQIYRENIITHGNQLVGSFLFFLPKSYWKDENKIVGTGQMLAEKCNYNYTNISMPLLGEGYANFGYWGIALFILIIIVINSFFDSLFLKRSKSIGLKIFFFFFLGFEFYLLRGDLYSSFKKMSSFILALIISLLFLNCFKRYITNKKS